MTLDDFKDVYKDKTPQEKLMLLARQFDTLCSDSICLTTEVRNHNAFGAAYWESECSAMRDRIEWLMQEILDAMRAQEPRVLTLAEAEAADCVYLDIRNYPVSSCILTRDERGAIIALRRGFIGTLEAEDYGRLWRCWSARPSDERRRAEAWEKS